MNVLKTCLVVSAMITTSTSCDGELERVMAVRRIINESGAKTSILVTNAIDTVPFELNPGDTTEFEGSCTYDERRYCNLGWEGNAQSEITFELDGKTTVWNHNFSGDFPDARRGIGANPQFEQFGYEGETVDGMIIYTFRILDSDIPE